MDKLFDFKKDEHSKLYRFQCDCITPEDALDIMVESQGKDNEEKFITITLYLIRMGLWQRIKDGMNILRGKHTWREFIPRKEDYKNFSEILDPNKKYSDLP